ncbi:hypothetical protein CDL15_Pgr009076 [Punica granatum]|uniref:Conserved oligomeric Golgi complex subunit 2 n=1 Tax=Punica granatum TaxID=22663 RepID=A0A218VYK8_PUNGR|nr:hypothetical protein CDL15_Pgr009076 [Punica granatum]
MADSIPSPSPTPPRSAADLFSDPLDSHPLWFKPTAFLSRDFDSESYISELRTFVPFDALRSELQSHLSALNHELIDLINRDYNDFVNLSTKLVDVDSAIVRMRAPLVELREKIEGFRGSVEASLVSLRNGLKQRSEAAAAREVLELLLDTFHVVSKVEKLIKELPTVPSDWSTGDANNNMMEKASSINNGLSLQHAEVGTNLRETQSMILERIASEMNRLKFYIAHAKVSQSLSLSLSFTHSLFIQNLPFVENMEKRIQNASQLLDASLSHCFMDGLEHRDANAIYNCLRAYAAIDNTGNAEEIFRTAIVTPMIQKIIPHDQLGVVDGASTELESDYRLIKQSIQEDCKFLLDIASAGRPTEFLRNYKTSLDFLAHLEGYCPSRSAVTRFRSEAAYVEFMKQWNLGVYFSLRFQEIAGALDFALSSTSLVPVQNQSPDGGNLTLKQSLTLLDSLRSCWKEDVLILSCSDKFLRLSLQLLARYSNWLSSGLAARKKVDAGSNPGCEWAASAVPDDFIYIIHDIDLLAQEVRGDYLRHILQLLSSCSAEICDSVKDSILHGGNSLSDMIPQVISTIIEALAEKAAESLLDGERAAAYMNAEVKSKLISGAATEITGRYYELASELVNVARKTESSLQRIRQGAQRRAGASSEISDNNVSDPDKICMQLFLDIQEYGRNLASLGVEAADIPSYCSLWQCVAPQDRQNTIKRSLDVPEPVLKETETNSSPCDLDA